MKAEEMVEILAEIDAVRRIERSEKDKKLLLNSWLAMFGNHTKEQILGAARIALKISEYVPGPQDIQKILTQFERKQSQFLTAEEAWQRLCKAARKGWDEEKLFKALDTQGFPIILKTVKAIGWDRITHTDHESLIWVRKEFIDLYDRFTNNKELEIIAFDGVVSKLLESIPVKRIQ